MKHLGGLGTPKTILGQSWGIRKSSGGTGSQNGNARGQNGSEDQHVCRLYVGGDRSVRVE